MCLNPQYMTNRGRSFNKTSDRLLLKVPCGECEECKAQRINDWIVRLYFEHLYTERLGGFVCFPTFTFDNNHLPYINLLHPFKKDEKGSEVLFIHHGIKSGDIIDTFHPTAKHPEYMSCVDRELWHKYTNSLKTYFDKIGYSCKWFYCWQYGETYGRVHIHAKMHVFPKEQHEESDTHNRRTSFDYCLNPLSFLEYLQRTWKYGEVSSSSLGFVVSDANKSSRYVSRYAVRDTSFEKEFSRKQEYFLREWEKDKNNPKFKFYNPLTDKEIRKIRPFVYSSANLGISAVLYQSKDDIKHQTITIPKQDSFVSVSLPLYLKRKYFFRVDDELRYKLTTEPKEIFFESMPKRTPAMNDSEYLEKCRRLHSLTYTPSGTQILPIILKDNIEKMTSRYEKTIETIYSIGSSNSLNLYMESISDISRVCQVPFTSSLEVRNYVLDLVGHIENTFPIKCARSLAIYNTLYQGYLDVIVRGQLDIDTWYFYNEDYIASRIMHILRRTFAPDSETCDTLGTDDCEFREEDGKIIKYQILTQEDAQARIQELLPYLFNRHSSFEGFDTLLKVLEIVDTQIRRDDIEHRQAEFRKKQAVKDYKNRIKYDKNR